MSLHEKYSNYRYCIYQECQNTSIRTPEKLWIKLPNKVDIRSTWLKLAKRDPDSISTASKLYLCEDHFVLENDIENYTEYKVMGSVKQIRMKPNCVPSRFECRIDRKRKLTQELSTTPFHEDLLSEGNAMPSSTSSFKKFHDKEVQVVQHNTKFYDQAVQVQPSTSDVYCQAVPSHAHKVVQVCVAKHYRSRAVQFRATAKDVLLSPIHMTSKQSTATSPIKPSMTGQSPRKRLIFTEEKYDSDQSYTYSQTSIDSSKPSSQTTEDSLQEKTTNEQHLQSTLSKIKNNPRLYIGIPKELYFLISIISNHTNISENHILLCLMKIRLNRTFSQLADDFNISSSQAGKIFKNKLHKLVNVLCPFVKTLTTSKSTIKKNLPIAFRHKYSKVTCIIDCLEIEIQKPKKAIHQALTWSEYKKANTIKYLVSCSPDGLVSFVSKGYGGRVTDVNLLEHSQFLDSLEPNSCILADRGFKHVEIYLKQKGFTLLRPPSVAAGVKLSRTEAKETKQIASLRIHVERVIRRLREFTILKPHAVVNLNFLDQLDLCVMTACALINIQDSIIR